MANGTCPHCKLYHSHHDRCGRINTATSAALPGRSLTHQVRGHGTFSAAPAAVDRFSKMTRAQVLRYVLRVYEGTRLGAWAGTSRPTGAAIPRRTWCTSRRTGSERTDEWDVGAARPGLDVSVPSRPPRRLAPLPRLDQGADGPLSPSRGAARARGRGAEALPRLGVLAARLLVDGWKGEFLMMPCDRCSPSTESGPGSPYGSDGKMLRGLKQVGKTRMAVPCGERTYRCQDCGTVWRCIFDGSTKQHRTEMVSEMGGAPIH